MNVLRVLSNSHFIFCMCLKWLYLAPSQPISSGKREEPSRWFLYIRTLKKQPTWFLTLSAADGLRRSQIQPFRHMQKIKREFESTGVISGGFRMDVLVAAAGEGKTHLVRAFIDHNNDASQDANGVQVLNVNIAIPTHAARS